MSPPLSALRTFGCVCYPYLRPYNKNKLLPTSVECVFLDYPPLSKGYLCLDPNTNTIYATCYALFNENVFHFAGKLDLTNSHIPFYTAILDSQWFPNTSSSSSSTLASTSSSPSSTSTDFLSLDLLQFSIPISYVPNPPLSTHSNSPSISHS